MAHMGHPRFLPISAYRTNGVVQSPAAFACHCWTSQQWPPCVEPGRASLATLHEPRPSAKPSGRATRAAPATPSSGARGIHFLRAPHGLHGWLAQQCPLEGLRLSKDHRRHSLFSPNSAYRTNGAVQSPAAFAGHCWTSQQRHRGTRATSMRSPIYWSSDCRANVTPVRTRWWLRHLLQSRSPMQIPQTCPHSRFELLAESLVSPLR